MRVKPYLQDADFTLYQGDVLDVLAGLPDESVHCVVTSPPYWGLRDYGTGSWEGGDPDCDHIPENARHGVERRSSTLGGGVAIFTAQEQGANARETCQRCGARRVDQQLGLEPTPELYVVRMVEVFREVRRVLRADGTCWLNLGDSYAGSWGNQGRKDERGTQRQINGPMLQPLDVRYPAKESNTGAVPAGLKPKDLVGIPWRVAFALQADGWWLRSEVTWGKLNPMPESVTDRPTSATEKVFLLTKSPRYFYDADAVAESAKWERWGDQTVGPGSNPDGWIKPKTKQELVGESRPGGRGDTYSGFNGRYAADDPASRRTRNLRNLWLIATQPYPEAHFATYPEELVRRCILAGTSERGCCPECGKPWERETDGASYYRDRDQTKPLQKYAAVGQGHGGVGRGPKSNLGASISQTLGWRPGCGCDIYKDATGTYARSPAPCTVLDPFLGSGTTAYVARAHGRRSIGIELSKDYCDLAARRLQQQSLFAEAF